MLIVGYLAAAPSINKCTKYSYSGCNTHTHTPTHPRTPEADNAVVSAAAVGDR